MHCSPSQFYLVLDVVNLTAQEMSLNYTSNKTILIEAKESCRVPVPVDRCPLDRILAAMEQQLHSFNSACHADGHPSMLSGMGVNSASDAGDLTERVCSEHIAENVNLKWCLPGLDCSGVASLRGISLSPTMLDLVTVPPLQWGKTYSCFLIVPQLVSQHVPLQDPHVLRAQSLKMYMWFYFRTSRPIKTIKTRFDRYHLTISNFENNIPEQNTATRK